MQPTAPELAILKCLWQSQPQSAREIHDEIQLQFGWSYSSTRKTLERMLDKNYLRASAVGNKKYYAATLDKVSTLASYVKDFSSRILELDQALPVAMFADSRLISEEEIEQLEAKLSELDKQDD